MTLVFIIGFIIGLNIGFIAALLWSVYLTRAPDPFDLHLEDIDPDAPRVRVRMDGVDA